MTNPPNLFKLVRACLTALLLLPIANAQGSELDTAREWLARNPPNGTNAVDRQQRMAVIQKACDLVPGKEYRDYGNCWATNAGKADQMEDAFPALHYLRAATSDAMTDIRRTKVTRGVAIWFIYNMGYVFKTPTTCFGIDIEGRNTETLAADLDFLLVSHEHADHYHAPLIEAMLARRKPVITRWFPGTTVVSEVKHFDFGDIHLKVDIGDHHHEQAGQTNNMLMFEVDCGPSANHALIYHSGDGNNYLKMRPTKPVDVYIPHVAVGMSVPEAINHLKPKLTLVSHVMELGHDIGKWRWSYDHAFGVIKGIPESQATVLTWGERYLLPRTALQDE